MATPGTTALTFDPFGFTAAMAAVTMPLRTSPANIVTTAASRSARSAAMRGRRHPAACDRRLRYRPADAADADERRGRSRRATCGRRPSRRRWAGSGAAQGYRTVSRNTPGQLGYSGSAFPVDVQTGSQANRRLTTSANPTTTFAASAVPTGAQRNDSCGTYTVNQLGVQGNSNNTTASADCR